MKSIYNSDVTPESLTSSGVLAALLAKALRDPEYLVGLIITAFVNDTPYDLKNKAMCKITPDFYAETMNEAAHALEDQIMMVLCAQEELVKKKFGIHVEPNPDVGPSVFEQIHNATIPSPSEHKPCPTCGKL